MRKIILISILLILLTACNSARRGGDDARPQTQPDDAPTIVRLDDEAIETATAVALVRSETEATPASPATSSAESEMATPAPTDSSGVEVADDDAVATPTPQTEANTPTPAPAEVTATPTATLAASDTAERLEIVTAGLFFRAGPGIAYETAGEGVKGDQFEVIGISVDGRWWQIINKDGEQVWISARTDYTQLVVGEIEEVPIVRDVVSPAESSLAPAEPALVSNSNSNRSQRTVRRSTTAQLIFASRNGGGLYTINLDGTDLRQLTSGVIDPVVSPNGQQVAFTRWNQGELGTLFVMNLDGSNERAVLGDILEAKSPTWSPDGQSIIVSFQHGGVRQPPELCKTFDVDDGVNIPRDVRITHFHRGSYGSRICYIKREDLRWSLRQIDVRSGAYEDLAVDLYSFAPTWNPEQAWQVIYEGDRGLMRFDLTSKAKVALTDDIQDAAPVFSPDGQTLAITYRQHNHWDIHTYNVASGARNRLTKPPLLADPQYNSVAPAWSPDGTQIAFLTDRTGPWEIWLMNADGSNQRPAFDPTVLADLGLSYGSANDRLLNWLGDTPTDRAPSTAAPAVVALEPLTGDWDFTFGTMSLSQRETNIDGTYQWYGGLDTGKIDGLVFNDLRQFQGLWVSDRSTNSQGLLRWALQGDSFSGGMRAGQWCGVRTGEPLPDGCGFSGTWLLHFGNPPGVTGEAKLVQIGNTVSGTYLDSNGLSGRLVGATVTVNSLTEMTLTGTWQDDAGQDDRFEWRLNLTTGQAFEGRRDPGLSEWCGWRVGTLRPAQCGWES